MKLIIKILLLLSITSLSYAEPKIKEICKDKKDKQGNIIKDKQGKNIQTCKKIKIRKKLEGTTIPN